jgi:hypothetical protein
VHILKEEYHTQEEWFRTRNKEQELLHNQQITMATSPGNGEGNIMHLEVPNKLPDGMQVDKERFGPRETTPMAWSPRKLGGSKKLAIKLKNSKNEVESSDELQELTPIVEGTSLEVTTNTQVATTLARVALENNHPSLDAYSSLWGMEEENDLNIIQRNKLNNKNNFQNGGKCYESWNSLMFSSELSYHLIHL